MNENLAACTEEIPGRVLRSCAYLLIGALLLWLFPFYFSPWWTPSWIHFGVLFAWAIAGVAWDPFRFGHDPAKAERRPADVSRRISLILLALVVLAPFILWVAGLDWFFPWLPWRSLAYRWIVRETATVIFMALLVQRTFPTLTFGRQFCLFIALLLLNHLCLMLAHAGMSGGPDYLSDGVTQEDFLDQFYFQLAAGVLVFVGSRLVIRKLKRGSIRRRTWILAGAIPVVLVAAGLACGCWQKAKEGPRMKGKSIAQWIAAASPVSNDRDPAVLALTEAGDAALPYLMNAFRTGKAEFHWFGSYSAPRPDQIRGNAAQVLKSLRNHAAPLVPALLECLNSGELELRKLAAEILGTTGVSNEAVRRALLHALGNSEIAYQASNALGALGWNDTNIVHDLVTTAKSATPTQSYWAVVSMGYLATNALPALPVLIDLAKNGDGQTRHAAIQAIALIGPEAQSAVPVLLTALVKGDACEKKSAVIALGRIGPAANAALPQLESLIKRADRNTRLDIAGALWRIDPNRVTNALHVAWAVVNRMLKEGVDSSTVSDSHRSALLLLGEMGSAARPAVPVLLECLPSPAPLVRFSAAWAICQAASDEKGPAVQTLEKLAAARTTAARAGTLSQALNEFREFEARYPAQLAAAGACWRLQPDRRREWRLAIVELLKEWAGWINLTDSVAEQKVLIPVLEDILADSTAREIHPLARSVLWKITGPAGVWW